MPWIFNPNRNSVTIVKANGVEGYLPGKARIYLHPDQIGADLRAKMQARILINKGGDPHGIEPAKAVETVEVAEDTSSKLHEDPAIVLADPTVEEPEKKPESFGEVSPVEVEEEGSGELVWPLETNDKSEDPDSSKRSRKKRNR